MKTDTIFSDPAMANTIASAIFRRSAALKRPGFLEMLTRWVRRRIG